MTSDKIEANDLTDEQIERVLNTRGFQKMLAYTRLSDGVGVLEDQDAIYDSLVNSITKQHKNNLSEDSVRECLRLFKEEVETFTEPLVEDDTGDEVSGDDLEDLYVEESEA